MWADPRISAVPDAAHVIEVSSARGHLVTQTRPGGEEMTTTASWRTPWSSRWPGPPASRLARPRGPSATFCVCTSRPRLTPFVGYM